MCARTVFAAWAVALAVATASAAQTDVRAIDVRGLDLGNASGGSVVAPVVITNLEELRSAVPNQLAVATISAAVDFDREHLLFFRWEGSCEDSLEPFVATRTQGREVVFIFRPGMTLDLTAHYRVFAIPADMSWRVEVIMPTAAR
jgi:hypothetical protein